MDNDYIKAAQKALEEVKQKAAQGKFLSSYRVEDLNDVSSLFQEFLMFGKDPVVRWQIEQARIVPVSPLKEALPLAADHRRATRSTCPQDCYRNAIKVSKKLGAMYCEGWARGSGLPFIRHAWNCIDETHFDVTAEQFLNWTLDSSIYVMSLALPAEEALALWKQRRSYEPYGGEILSGIYWRNYVENSTEVTKS
ncbi:MAG: hypothetical protein ACLP5H_23665 [Desulfomonilaceae bacterium]